MDKIDGEKSCKTCEYYVALYTKEKDRFKTISGYCINNTAGIRRREHSQFHCCEDWEQREIVDVRENKSVSEFIFTMQKQLAQLLELLENEE